LQHLASDSTGGTDYGNSISHFIPHRLVMPLMASV